MSAFIMFFGFMILIAGVVLKMSAEEKETSSLSGHLSILIGMLITLIGMFMYVLM